MKAEYIRDVGETGKRVAKAIVAAKGKTMNDADSKMVEEIKKRQRQGKYREHGGDIAYLLMVAEHRDTIISQQKWDLDKAHVRDLDAKVKEQDREIERLQKTIDEGIISVASDEANYQRRHRKWALKRLSCYLWSYREQMWRANTAEAEAQQERINAEEWYLKAQEAEAGESKAVTVLEACERIALGLKARIKELEQELLWAAEACEKAENLLAEKEKV